MSTLRGAFGMGVCFPPSLAMAAVFLLALMQASAAGEPATQVPSKSASTASVTIHVNASEKVLARGAALYKQVCSACHGPVASDRPWVDSKLTSLQQAIQFAQHSGAPKLGDAWSWQPHLAKGIDVLDEHAIHGYSGSSGVMPPRGGSNASDADVKAAVDFMLASLAPSQNQPSKNLTGKPEDRYKNNRVSR